MISALIALVFLITIPHRSWVPAQAEARVSARIVTAARIHLGPTDPHMVKASVHIDGARRPAMLVEFQ